MKPIASILFLFIVSFACKQDKKYHDTKQKSSKVIADNGVLQILEFQNNLNEEFKNPEISPLPDRYRKDFEALEFFEPDTTYIVKADFVLTPDALPFLMPTTTERTSEEVVYGIAHFMLNGVKHQLEIYQSKELMQKEGFEEYLFLPFTDETNGVETYAGGRYIDLSIPTGNTIVIDFNRAYNPYCVYNKKYSCALVPSVNTLKTRVLAGVMDFKKGK